MSRRDGGNQTTLGKAEYYGKDNYFSKNRFLFSALRKGGYHGYENFDDPKLWEWKLRKIGRYKKGGRALDIGCAYGAFLNALPDSFERYGTDISRDAIAYMKKNRKNIVAKWGDLDRNFVFPNKKFDVITMFDTIEHLFDLNCSMKRIQNALAKDGYLFVLVPVASRFNSLLYLFKLSLLWSDDSHVNILHTKAWLKFFNEFFEVVDHFPLTYKGSYIPGCESYRFFVMRHKCGKQKA